MLLIKTKIGPSAVHGIGLFADQFIPKGTVTWQYAPNVDVGITKQEIESLPQLSKEYFLYYSYYDKKRDLHILPVDHLKFINHSAKEDLINIDSTPDQDIARRDIQIGEELLCNYNNFDDLYFERIHLASEDIK